MTLNEHNPYASPTIDHQPQMPYGQSGTWVRQVRIVTILMMVHGVIEFMFGGYMIAMGIWLPNLIAQQQNAMAPEQQRMMSNIMFGIAIGGGFALLAGVFRIIAGIRGFFFRGRIMGIISHFLGLLLVFTFYCAPTGIALCIYGCMVYFNREVAQSFEMRKEGHSVPEILAQFR